jgi:hypothetical protein
VSGVFGLDVQHSRVVITLLEGDREQAFVQPIGDGTRLLVPAAYQDPDLFGSQAAEAALRGLAPNRARLAEHLSGWRCDPLQPPFLRGLYRRLSAYLGQTAPIHRNGYHICVAAEPAAVPDGSFAAAGLTSVSTVHPSDALVCRWLTEPGTGAHTGELVAVGCGQTWTDIGHYRLQHRESGPALCRDRVRRVPTGIDTVGQELARRVLERAGESVHPASLLPMLDGIVEFGAMLRAEPPGTEVEWTGPLADRMFAPLRLSRSELDRWPQVRGMVQAITAEIAVASGEAPLILVGGFGGVWPFVADALAGRGTVWQSQSPAEDLAAGAAWWPALQSRFSTGSKTLDPLAPGNPTRELTDWARPTDIEIAREEAPPWLRP